MKTDPRSDNLGSDNQDRESLIGRIADEYADRLERNERPGVEEYVQRYPELADDQNALLGLIAVEYQCRREREPDLTIEEYLRRFPDLGDSLRQRLSTPEQPEAMGSSPNFN